MLLNLKDEYTRLNKLLFDNKLPQNVKVKWFSSRQNIGRIDIYFLPGMRKYMSSTIHISDLYNCTIQDYLDTLAHEMIHLSLFLEGKTKSHGKQHDTSFLAYVDLINSNHPKFNIATSDTINRQINISKVPTMHGYLIVLQNGEIFYNLYKDEITRHLFSKILYALHTVPKLHGAVAYTFSGKYPELMSSIVRRKEKTLKHNLQFLKDKHEAVELYEKVKKTAPFHCPLTLEKTS